MVTRSAALSGGYGLAASASNGSAYVVDTTPANERSYRARFYFNPNNASLSGDVVTIFAGRTSTGVTAFRVQARRSGGTYQVRAAATSAGSTVQSGWLAIANGSSTTIEISWRSGAASTFDLYLNGALRASLTGVESSSYSIDTVWLGPSAGQSSGTSNPLYFDGFVSTRTAYIGP